MNSTLLIGMIALLFCDTVESNIHPTFCMLTSSEESASYVNSQRGREACCKAMPVQELKIEWDVILCCRGDLLA